MTTQWLEYEAWMICAQCRCALLPSLAQHRVPSFAAIIDQFIQGLTACLNERGEPVTLEDGQFPTDSYIADGLSRLRRAIAAREARYCRAYWTLSESALSAVPR